MARPHMLMCHSVADVDVSVLTDDRHAPAGDVVLGVGFYTHPSQQSTMFLAVH